MYRYISVDETDSSPMGVLLWVHKPSPNTTPQCTEYQILKVANTKTNAVSEPQVVSTGPLNQENMVQDNNSINN